MELQVGVLLFFGSFILIGVCLVVFGEAQNFSDSPNKSYKLKIEETAEYCTLYYSTSYGIFWKRVPIRIGGFFRPKSITSVKADDVDGMENLLYMFDLFLNNQYKLLCYLEEHKIDLLEKQADHDAKKAANILSKVKNA